jgi:hypothetical protein
MTDTPHMDQGECRTRIELAKKLSDAAGRFLKTSSSDPNYILAVDSLDAATTAYRKHLETHQCQPKPPRSNER